MASSRNSPGPRERAIGVERQKCIKITFHGTRCKRWATRGSKLCRGHREEIILDPPPEARVRGNVTRKVKSSITGFVIGQQARSALAKLGVRDAGSDPKSTLLDMVRSSHQQALVWEAMLNSVPDEDWAAIGQVPIPGLIATAKGARIETIQRFLGEATKSAARASKLAIDAGIEERIVKLAEEQSALIADTVRAGLIAGIGALHLSPEAEAAAISSAVGSAAHHLRALAAGGQEILDGVAVKVEPKLVSRPTES